MPDCERTVPLKIASVSQNASHGLGAPAQSHANPMLAEKSMTKSAANQHQTVLACIIDIVSLRYVDAESSIRRSRPVISVGFSIPSKLNIVGATSSSAPPSRSFTPIESSSIS